MPQRERLLQSLAGLVRSRRTEEIPKHLSGITPLGTTVSVLNQVSDSHKGRRRAPLLSTPQKCIVAEVSLLCAFLSVVNASKQETFENNAKFSLLIKAFFYTQNILRKHVVSCEYSVLDLYRYRAQLKKSYDKR